MKKVILATLASTLIASSASADFYASAHVGGDTGKFVNMLEVKSDMTDLSLERDMNLKGGLEVGYKVMDNLAVGVAVSGYMDTTYKSATDNKVAKEAFLKGVSNEATAAAHKDGVTVVESHKFSAMAAMASARLDLVDLDAVQVYVTGGVGGAMLSEEMNVSVAKVDAVPADTTATPPVEARVEFPAHETKSVKTESVNNVAFSAGAGVAFKLSDEMSVNLGAEYVNLGSTGEKFENDEAKAKADKVGFKGKTSFQAINAVVGVRFCF